MSEITREEFYQLKQQLSELQQTLDDFEQQLVNSDEFEPFVEKVNQFMEDYADDKPKVSFDTFKTAIETLEQRIDAAGIGSSDPEEQQIVSGSPLDTSDFVPKYEYDQLAARVAEIEEWREDVSQGTD
jgi:hypothetical protein